MTKEIASWVIAFAILVVSRAVIETKPTPATRVLSWVLLCCAQMAAFALLDRCP